MAWARTFRITTGKRGDISGIPDKEIKSFITECEAHGIMQVSTTYVPPIPPADARLFVVVTKLDDR